MFYDRDDDYIVDLDSDDGRNFESSSEDEVDVILHGTPKQKRRLCRRSLGQQSSSEDEFEKEMEAELNQTMKTLEQRYDEQSGSRDKQTLGSGASTSAAAAKDEPQTEYYDADYFDSDSDEEESSEKKKSRKQKVLSNDELFYDPDMDDEDQRWIDQQRQKYQPSTRGQASGSKPQRPAPLPTSDAVLNCPACMTTLCLDCQRHELYKNQYRAMFVRNCTVDMNEVMRYPRKQNRGRRKRKHGEDKDSEQTTTLPGGGKESSQTEGNPDELYHPVRCTECNTEVGVYDKDEVFHFFNVLASYA